MATLKEKIHHLDDMLKSQQRKVRHMIEQVFMSTGRLPGVARRTQTHTMQMLPLVPTNTQEAINKEI